MPKNKKKFISKKGSVTFQLVHRSQQDPLAADEQAPQHVLMESGSNKNTEEEHKYGIFFDDQYDYLQHLKDSDETEVFWDQVNLKGNAKTKSEKSAQSKTPIQLPSSVFASHVEESVGLLNKAAPIHGLRLDLDPDIVAALDDDFDFDDPDNILEDDFMNLANMESENISEEEEEDDDDEMEDDVPSLCNDMDFADVETKSHFTNYSMTSSVIRRNEQLSLLDSRFEKMFEGYAGTEIGALDCEEIEGTIAMNDKILLDLAEQTLGKNSLDEANLKEKILSAVGEESEEEMERLVVKDKEKWDCESILSTYSNLYNHPAKICEPKGPRKIRVSKKTGIPLDELGGHGGPRLTAHALAELDNEGESRGPRSVISMASELSIRPKDETPEQKKLRKQNLKEYRKERRVERKANTMAFKDEKSRQEKVMLNLKNNLQGIKIL